MTDDNIIDLNTQRTDSDHIIQQDKNFADAEAFEATARMIHEHIIEHGTSGFAIIVGNDDFRLTRAVWVADEGRIADLLGHIEMAKAPIVQAGIDEFEEPDDY